jgi:hypothetical protein
VQKHRQQGSRAKANLPRQARQLFGEGETVGQGINQGVAKGWMVCLEKAKSFYRIN